MDTADITEQQLHEKGQYQQDFDLIVLRPLIDRPETFLKFLQARLAVPENVFADPGVPV